MIQPKNQAEDLLLSITINASSSNSEKSRTNIGIQNDQNKKTFHFKPSISIEGS